MIRKFKRYISLIGMLILSLCILSGCAGTGSEVSVKRERIKSETENEQKEETSPEPSKEKEETKDEEEYLDVENVEENETDYSKYEEKTTKKTDGGTSTQQGDTQGITYSDGESQEQDEYQTDPVPEGMQNPVEPGEIEIDQEKENTCYLSISCSTILDNMKDLTEGKETLVPSDGQIYAQREVSFYEGESVFDILQRETKNNRIHMEYSFFPGFNSNYVEGINNLYEFDCGKNSGWMYCVNGWYPNYGCSRYVVQDGDVIEWNYTCDLGRDLGRDADWGVQNGAR